MDGNITVDEYNQAVKESRFKRYAKYFMKLGKIAKKAGFAKVDQSFVNYLDSLVDSDLEKKEKAKLREAKKLESPEKVKEVE